MQADISGLGVEPPVTLRGTRGGPLLHHGVDGQIQRDVCGDEPRVLGPGLSSFMCVAHGPASYSKVGSMNPMSAITVPFRGWWTTSTVAEVVGTELIVSVSPPGALPVMGLDRYVEIFSQAARLGDQTG